MKRKYRKKSNLFAAMHLPKAYSEQHEQDIIDLQKKVEYDETVLKNKGIDPHKINETTVNEIMGKII